MRTVILRYGALLAAFLIVLETAKRSYISFETGVEVYVGFVALVFLVLGIWLARRVYQQNTVDGDNSLKILDSADFSEREQEVLLFLCHGYTNKEIAEQLQITTNTVKSHLKNIYGKLEVTNRTQAAAEAKLLKIVG